MARFDVLRQESRHNRAMPYHTAPSSSITSATLTTAALQKDLLQAVHQSSAGLTLTELLASTHTPIPRRTAQRWLGQWVAEGRIVAQGEARARRYYYGSSPPSNPSVPDTFPASIPLSIDSTDIVAYVDQPLTARKPVGYQHDFLQDYQPHEMGYLSESLRHHLHKIGRTSHAHTPAGTYSRAIFNRLLIDLSWASSQLEGNTYSRLDTRALIEQGQKAHGKAAMETQMILNHKSAIELLVDNVETAQFDRYTLMNLHAILSENLLPHRADEGRIRQHAVEIGKSVFRPLAVPQQLNDQLTLLLDTVNQITDPFEQCFFILVHLPYLQPFADINKRTSRLLANLPLFRANLCPLTFLDVPESAYSRAMLGVYELTRVELLRDVFVWAYERSTREYLIIRQELAEPDPLRLSHRSFIRDTVHAVVTAVATNPATDAMRYVADAVSREIPAANRPAVQALVVEELHHLHEGVLARYALRPSEFRLWKAHIASFF